MSAAIVTTFLWAFLTLSILSAWVATFLFLIHFAEVRAHTPVWMWLGRMAALTTLLMGCAAIVTVWIHGG